MTSKFLGILLAILVPVINILTAPLVKIVDSSYKSVSERAGGFIKGVCHANPDFDLLHEAKIEWIREDIPYPFDENGEENFFYKWTKQEMLKYAENGIKIFAVTPNPKDFLANGLDIRREEDYEKIMAVQRYYVEDLRGIVSAYQVANEMGVDRFTEPYTMEEAAYFVGESLKAMHPLVKDEIIGYNLGGMGYVNLTFKMLKYSDYCDYVGVDIYLGCFENIVKNIDTFFTLMNLVRVITRKPIIITEFGYIGCGEPKTEEEKQEILRSYGFESEEEVKNDVDTFISRLPSSLKDEIERLYSGKSDEDKFDLLFNGEYKHHIYRELSEGTGLKGYEHTPEGQADFYSYLIPKIRSKPWCIGAIIYMWHDSEACYVCGQSDCPVETGWGLVDGSGNPKPAFYAVKKAFE